MLIQLRALSRLLLVSLFSVVLSIAAVAAPENISELEGVSSSAELIKNTRAVAFSKKYKNLNLKKAYSLQKAFAKNAVAKGTKIIGYKAGLMTEAAIKEYGLLQPITGVLLRAPLSDNSQIKLQDSFGLMIEQELAFKVQKKITRHLKMDELKNTISAVAPAIELPDFSFQQQTFNGLDVIANNALAYQFIIGKWQDKNQDVDSLAISISCNNEVLSKTTSANVMTGQWQALLWMVNHLIDLGYQIEPEQILITGDFGARLFAKPCVYQADYGALGRLQFEVID